MTAAEWLVDLRWLQAQSLRRHEWERLPVRGPGNPIPRRGIMPEGREWPSIEDERPSIAPDPVLVRASRETWQRTTPAPVETLSQVLALCHDAMTLDEMRRRDAGR